MTQLYKLTGQWAELQSMDFDPAVIKDTLESIKGEIKEKAQNIAFVNANMSARIDAIDGEIKRLQAMKKTEQNKQEALKDYLRTNMENMGVKKIECDLFTITLRKPVDVVSIDNPDDIPRDYYKVVESIDKTLIKQALKDGHDVKGASLVAGKAGLLIK